MPYLMNTWYVAAWPNEIGPNGHKARTILDRELVLFRKADGSLAALDDRCPHRFAPLSAGTVRGDHIACRYHGLGFDGEGRCVVNPHGPPLKGTAIRSYPICEKHRAIWIWMGDPALADTAKIPDLSYLSAAPESAFSTGYLHSVGHYELMTDNIMDLSHTDYLHPDTLGGAQITTTKPEITETEDYIEQNWFAAKTKPSPALISLFPELPAETDLLQGVRWYAPAVMRLVAATVAAGRPLEEGYTNLNAHIMTPETAKTTHYFFAATRNYKVDDEDLNRRLAATRERIFATEDKPMIESVQRKMGDREFWSMKPIVMPIDVGPARVRRRLQKMIEAEQGASATRTE